MSSGAERMTMAPWVPVADVANHLGFTGDSVPCGIDGCRLHEHKIGRLRTLVLSRVPFLMIRATSRVSVVTAGRFVLTPANGERGRRVPHDGCLSRGLRRDGRGLAAVEPRPGLEALTGIGRDVPDESQ